MGPALIDNTKIAEYDCAWCSAIKGADVHSAACPVGERYKQVQQLGGVPWIESNGRCAQKPRRKTGASQGEAAGIRSAGPADTEQSEASRALDREWAAIVAIERAQPDYDEPNELPF